MALWGAFFNFLAVFTIGALARRANSHLFAKSFRESVTKTLGPSETEESEKEGEDPENPQQTVGRMGLLHRLSSRLIKGTVEHKDDLLREIRYPLDKMDIRLMDAENFDEMGRLIITKEELYYPSSVFGELRLMALREHSRKREAAGKISKFYRDSFQRKAQSSWSTCILNHDELSDSSVAN